MKFQLILLLAVAHGVVFSIFAPSSAAEPRRDCEVALQRLGYDLKTYAFKEKGLFRKEKHVFNGGLVCYVSRKEPTAAPSGSPASGNLTAAQRNAVRSAKSYLQFSGFSRQGLIDQLSSEFGDKYSVGDATVAVDSLSIDWNAQAARSAVSYLKFSGFSCQGLIDQLSSEFGDKYTVEQATYGATQVGIC